MCLFLKWREVRATTRERCAPAAGGRGPTCPFVIFRFWEKINNLLYSNQCLFVRRLLRVQYYLWTCSRTDGLCRRQHIYAVYYCTERAPCPGYTWAYSVDTSVTTVHFNSRYIDIQLNHWELIIWETTIILCFKLCMYKSFLVKLLTQLGLDESQTMPKCKQRINMFGSNIRSTY